MDENKEPNFDENTKFSLKGTSEFLKNSARIHVAEQKAELYEKKCTKIQKRLSIIVCIMFLSVVLNVYTIRSNIKTQNNLYEAISKQEELKKEIKSLETKNTKANKKIKELEKPLDFYYSYAAIVTANAGEKYHRYDCQYVRGRDFYIYNIHLAESYGYEPCSVCWD